MTESVPVLDLASENFSSQLLEACRTIGFASIVGHGIDQSLLHAMRETVSSLFALPDRVKAESMITPANYRGWIPLGFFTPNRSEVNGAEGDHYEGWKLHWECPPDHPVREQCHLYGPNVWAAEVPDMESIVTRYWKACDALAETVMPIFADALSISAATFGQWHQTPLTNMTLLHYPPSPAATDVTGIHPHKDTNVITFLHPDPAGGLEVRRSDGTWITATSEGSPPDAILMNIGEMLELWSGGEFVATPHQVINVTGRDRYSFPWFLVPSHDVTVEPLVPAQPGYARAPMPVGELSAEVWRTNWPDEKPSGAGHDLGSLDR